MFKVNMENTTISGYLLASKTQTTAYNEWEDTNAAIG